MNEFALIKRYFQDAQTASQVVLGIGDDCALLDIPGHHHLAVSVDSLVEGVHFPKTYAPEKIATRAFAVALSDLAAMGAKPLGFTLSLTLPEALVSDAWLAPFASGLLQVAAQYRCPLIGGDTTRGRLTVGVQVLGAVEQGRALTRSGAEAGDQVFVTGPLGDGAAALAVLMGELTLPAEQSAYLERRFSQPQARIAAGRALLGIASSAIDISDGLLADLGHICDASGVGARLELSGIPYSRGLQSYVRPQQLLQWALSGGDDYQLCFTLPPEQRPALDRLCANGQLEAHCIGEMVLHSGIDCRLNGAVYQPEATGYSHFD
ncbi:thiamine-phosphate kinase [Teredinibacter waterburyi]|uniref:thiamine-phosphate kinase n=1 Tax=Teredinibacter waterburyi TaxID=1500538 RepID=UPI00165EE4EB|nr:thiamine-phosphate kinase [Teredinibacter waterburyi]